MASGSTAVYLLPYPLPTDGVDIAGDIESLADGIDNVLQSKAASLSPVFTGTPTAPTATADTSTTQIATTAFVIGQAGTATPLINGSATVGTSLRFSRQDHIHPTDTTRAPLASPALTGTPTAPTAAVDTNTTQIATTAFVIGQSYAKLASPALTGIPTAPTAAVSTNTTQIATTAFVLGQANSTAATISMNGTQNAGTSNLYARADHIHPIDTSRAPLASPTFTGTPAAPTAAVDTNSTQIATTAFVIGQGYLKSATASSTYAPIASPTFTGTVTSPKYVASGAQTLAEYRVRNIYVSITDPGTGNEGDIWLKYV